MPHELEALLARVKAASGPDRTLDVRIQAILGQPGQWSEADIEYACTDPDRTCGPPYFTASIDTALALAERVLPKWSIQMWMSEGYRHPGVIMGRSYPKNLRVAIEGATLPLTIIAALLSAKIDEARQALSDAQEEPAPWPSGCIKPGSCGRHEACMYAMSTDKCRHYGRNLATEVHAYREPALAAARQGGGEHG